MYSLDQLYNQALQKDPIILKKELGTSLVSYGFKLQKFESKTEILNCARNGDYFQELNDNEYKLFQQYGWEKGCIVHITKVFLLY